MISVFPRKHFYIGSSNLSDRGLTKYQFYKTFFIVTGRLDIQPNDTQYNGTQHEDAVYNDTRYDGTLLCNVIYAEYLK
jgi:hypothetical protein